MYVPQLKSRKSKEFILDFEKIKKAIRIQSTFTLSINLKKEDFLEKYDHCFS